MKSLRKILISILLLLLTCSMGGCGNKKEESFRSIRVMTLNGTAMVERPSIGELSAYEDMLLQSGDDVFVAEDSSMVLNLDEDKYILLESGTEMTLVAEGNSTDSKTTIDLRKGAIVNNITQKLSEDSSYEVNVPNSTMAVRGTVFRVAIYFDENEDSYAIVTVLSGQVATRLVFPDGTVQSIEEEKVIPTSKQVRIHGDSEISEYIYDELEDVDLELYSYEALDFLKLCLENGESLSVDKETIEKVIEAVLENRNEEEGKKEEEKEDVMEEELAAAEEAAETPLERVENIQAVIPEVTATPMPTPTSYPVPSDPVGEANDTDNTAGGSTPAPTTSPTLTPSATPMPSATPTPSVTPTPSATPTPGETPIITYRVTFKYNGSTFCYQDVESGGTAVCPTLMPTQNGAWDWNFSTSISSDTIIRWINTPEQ